MSDDNREWKTDPIKKYGDFSPPADRAKRNLPSPGLKYTPSEETEEIRLRRSADDQFRIKRTK